ncbi:zinc-binding dehydrogenase [Saccharomonospora sp. CUA-673]|uniref:zinc-binding dehydrogenase n=1 Tax=Saccharomonospora sp. CUA-673 TaxID=1904969 RepID=UPI003512E9A5
MPDARRAELCAEVAAEAVPLVARGAVRPFVDAVFPFEDVAAAHTRFGEPGKMGKVVVTLSAGTDRENR